MANDDTEPARPAEPPAPPDVDAPEPTAEERAAAVVRGFETAYRERRRFSEAIGIWLNYVERL